MTATKKTARPATKKPATKKAPAAKTSAAKPAAPAPAKKAARVSMWATARQMIVAGKSNAEVLAALKAQFDLPPEHDYYPRWYRAHAVMKKLVTKAFAAEHAGPPIARKPAAAKP